MITHIALLHSIVLGGGRRLNMVDWRDMMVAIGLHDVRTWIATGNALFDGGDADPTDLEQRLEGAFIARFGRHIDTIVMTAAQWRALAAANPFPEETDGTRVAVRIMREPLSDGELAGLLTYATAGERLGLVGGHLCIHFAQDPTRSRLARQLTVKRLGVGTVRNWNTVRRLDEMIAG